MIKELLVSTALLCSASLSFSYCMGEDRIVVERKIVQSDYRPHRAPEQLPIDCIYNDVMSQVEVQFKNVIDGATIKLTNLVTGETMTEYATAGVTLVIIPLSYSGTYLLEINLTDGREYYGTFDAVSE